MRKSFSIFLAVLLVFTLMLALSSCDFIKTPSEDDGKVDNGSTDNDNGGNTDGDGSGNGNTDGSGDGNTDGSGDGNTDGSGGGNTDGSGDGNTDDVTLEGIVLVERGAPKFSIVVSTGAGSATLKLASQFAKDLQALGITVPVYKDNETANISDCEILIGSALKNRGDNMNVSAKVLGNDGYVIKTEGERILIAGGNTSLTEQALEIFKRDYMGITEKTETLRNLAVPETIFIEHITDYPIDSIRVLGTDLSFYVIAYDTTDLVVEGMVADFSSLLYERAGYIISAHSIASVADSDPKIIVRSVSDAGEDGFRAFIDGDDLVIECAYKNAFEDSFYEYLDYQFPESAESISFDADYLYTDHVSTVKYSDFGAVGDGVTDDFLAMYSAHEYANLGGQKVLADSGAVYYIGESSFGKSISVRTDVDWGDATIIIDDSILPPYSSGGNDRRADIFAANPDTAISYIPDSDRYAMSLTKGQANIGFTFEEAKFVHIVNANRKIYIRYGSNANSGSNLSELILVDAEGNVDESTPIMWDYETLTSVTLYSAGDKQITITGGTFITWACKLWDMTNVEGSWINGDQYYYYNRGILISRSNTVVDGVTHYVEKEGANGYPYTGFYNVKFATNVLIKNCIMTAHKTYTEDRDTDGDGQPNENKGTMMGSYDIAASYANAITWQNCTQSNFYKSGSTPYSQNEYWGVMGTNYCKNLTYDGCTLSRFDAHCGVYNATVKNSTIAFAINSVGAGTFTIDNVTMLTGKGMLTLRSDYGSTWEGTVIIKDSTLKTSTSTAYLIQTTWYNHDFGYTCYIPNVIVDNFKTSASTVYVYSLNSNSVNPSIAFTSTTNPLTFMNGAYMISRNKPSNYTLKVSNNSTMNSKISITNE